MENSAYITALKQQIT